MKKFDFLYIFLLLTSIFSSFCNENNHFFSKVIIWGHPLHSHTHSYIHWSFFKTFKHLGYETYWVNSLNELSDIDLSQALFITEGQADSQIPKRVDCYYILHNCNHDDYQELFSQNRCILLQVYTHDCLQYNFEKIDDYIYCDIQQKLIFMPWATDLLPEEIEYIKKNITSSRSNIIYWIGTIGKGKFGNNNEIENFQKACIESAIEFKHVTNADMKTGMELIQSSCIAPTIQGPYQCEKGYIPCRIFKNISYGQWGITNNETVYNLFKKKIIYNQDTYQLFYDAQKYMNNACINELYELMDFVKNNHTYINRIETLLSFMKKALAVEEKNEMY